MIKVIDKPPIKFGKIVKETTENILLEYSFAFCDDFPCAPEEDDNVIYSRIRNGIEEQIKFFRRNYSNEYDEDVIDEVEAKRLYLDGKDSEFYDENQFYWISRHWFEVLLIVNYGHRNLLLTGKAGIGRDGEEYWYFEDEEDLQRLLKEKVAPLLTTVVIKDFDEQLKDELENLSKEKSNPIKVISLIPSQIAFVKKDDAVEAVITEITEENIDINYLKKIFESGKKIAEADEEYGHLVSEFVCRVITNNSKLVKTIETHPTFKQEFPNLIVIFENQ